MAAHSADTVLAARLALESLDLTSLNDGDTEADIAKLCERAQGPAGQVAAVCVWPRFVAFARSRLPESIAVAAVANFPDGSIDIERAVRDTKEIVEAGGDEVDVVMPYRQLDAAPALLEAVRQACDGLCLKVIIETGELVDAALIQRAAQIAIDAGANFLKTSTGKTPVSATTAAARLLLRTIAADPAAKSSVGFKASGGIRTVADAAIYLALTADILGDDAVDATRFRIGASSLLNDIEAVLGTKPGAPKAAGTY